MPQGSLSGDALTRSSPAPPLLVPYARHILTEAQVDMHQPVPLATCRVWVSGCWRRRLITRLKSSEFTLVKPNFLSGSARQGSRPSQASSSPRKGAGWGTWHTSQGLGFGPILLPAEHGTHSARQAAPPAPEQPAGATSCRAQPLSMATWSVKRLLLLGGRAVTAQRAVPAAGRRG